MDSNFISEVTLLFSHYLSNGIDEITFEEELSMPLLELEGQNINSQSYDNFSKSNSENIFDSTKSNDLILPSKTYQKSQKSQIKEDKFETTKNSKKSNKSYSQNEEIHDKNSKSNIISGLNQYKGDAHLILSEFDRICEDYSISEEAQAELLSIFVFDETQEVHNIIPSALKTDIYNLFKKYNSKLGKKLQQSFERELFEILDNPLYTCRNYKSREELTSELNELKKQIKGRILISDQLQEQIKDLISCHVSKFENEQQFELELSELLATPDLIPEEQTGILKEELTKEKLEQKLNESLEEKKIYQEKFEMISSQLQDATNHPLFDNIEQAQNSIRLVNKECSNIEKLLSNLT